MWQTLLVVLAIFGFMLQLSHAQEANPVLVDVAKAMGAIDLKSLQYTGSGSLFATGQNPSPGMPWLRYQRQKLHPHDQLRHSGNAGRNRPHPG